MRFVGITSGSRTNSGEFQGAGDDGGDCGHETVWQIAWNKSWRRARSFRRTKEHEKLNYLKTNVKTDG